MLIRLYSSHKDPSNLYPKSEPVKLTNGDEESSRRHTNGHPRGGANAERQARDVQEFELEGLISGDEDDGDDEAESSSDGALRKHGGRGR